MLATDPPENLRKRPCELRLRTMRPSSFEALAELRELRDMRDICEISLSLELGLLTLVVLPDSVERCDVILSVTSLTLSQASELACLALLAPSLGMVDAAQPIS